MIIYILLSITLNKNEILPYATSFKTEKSCMAAKNKIDEAYIKRYGNSMVMCTKQKVRK